MWRGALPVMILLLFFMGTGWVQFGNRYLLDVMPFAILLVGVGMRGRLTRTAVLLIALSAVIHAWGTYRFRVEQM